MAIRDGLTRLRRLGVVVPAAIAVGLCTVVAPLGALVWWGLGAGAPRPGRRAGALADTITDPLTWRLLAVTAGQATASTLITLLVGLPVAWALWRYRVPGARAVRTLVTVPFVLPTVVVAAAVRALFDLGGAGAVDQAGWWPILLAHLIFNVAVVVRTVGPAVGGLDPRAEETARLCGLSAGPRFLRVVLPALGPSVAAAALIVWLFCATSFGVVQMLGGVGRRTIETEIWYRVSGAFDLSGAAVLAVLQTMVVVLVIGAHQRLERTRARVGGHVRIDVARRPRAAWAWGMAVGGAGLGVAVAAPPLVVLAYRSLYSPSGLTLDHWRNLGSVVRGTTLAVPVSVAMFNSLTTAALAAIPATLLGVGLARRIARGGRVSRVLDGLLLLPLGLSAATIGIGMLLAYGRPPIDLRGWWGLVPLAQFVVALPLVVRSLTPALRRHGPGVIEAARTLGARPARVLWAVELPLVRPALVGAAALSTAVTLGEFGATVFLARADRPTLPLLIERLASRPASAAVGQAMVAACLLAATCALAMVLLDARRGEAARF